MQTEMTSILAATQPAIQEQSCKNMYVCTDSRAFPTALQTMTAKSRLFLECHNTLKGLADEIIVEMIWMPAHRGIRGKDIVDNLVKLGGGQLIVCPETAVGISDE